MTSHFKWLQLLHFVLASAQEPEPSPWPLHFSVPIITGNQILGAVYYSWDMAVPALYNISQVQRVDHAAGNYECIHFYNTTGPCTLIFNSAGMYAFFTKAEKPFCCLDLAGVGAPIPNFTTYFTFVANEECTVPQIGNSSCRHWLSKGEDCHNYWDTLTEVAGLHLPVRFGFPNISQDYFFAWTKLNESQQDASLFVVPAKCNVKCV